MQHTPSESNKLLIRHLLLVFEQKIGFPITSVSACHKASEVLRNERIALSGHTIARLFGILKSKSKPYESTLNLIAQFCGFSDFNQHVTSARLVGVGALDEAQILLNKNNARLEVALRFAIQTEDEASIHSLLEQIEEDPYALWLSNLGSFIYAMPRTKQMRLLKILSKSALGIKYFYEQYINENDTQGTFADALDTYYQSPITLNQKALFPQLFRFSKAAYRGKRRLNNELKLSNLRSSLDKENLHFHLRSRIFEVEILCADLQKRKSSQHSIVHAFAESALREAALLNTVDKTWFYSRICKAVAYKDVLLVLLEHNEFRNEIHHLYDSQKELVYYPALMLLQTVLHFYWAKNALEHGYVFKLHHPFCTQNETISIKSMEAFGLALYDKSFIGASIRKNLPLTIKQNGQLWMKGLLPALN